MKDEEGRPFPAPDKMEAKQSRGNRRMIVKIMMVGFLGIGLLAYGIGILSRSSDAQTTAERMGSMSLAKQNTAVNQGIPPIDAVAPAKMETATFALG